MSKLVWDQTGSKLFETGIEKAVLFVMKNGAYEKGVAWSGVTSVSEKPSGAEDTPLYADNIKYLNLKSNEEFGATIEAYMYPDEWEQCDGSAELATGVTIGQQARSKFALAYVTKIGNDTDLNDHGYKIHIIYNAQAAPSEKQYQTVNDSPEAITFSWEISTTPENVTGFKPTANVVIDSTKVDAGKLKTFEDMLYGSESTESQLMLPDAIMAHFKTTAG